MKIFTYIHILYLNIFVVVQFAYWTKAEVYWIAEILDVTIENTTHMDVDLNITLNRPSRTDTTINGLLNFKVDINDDFCLTVDIFHSAQGNENSYIRTPYHITNMCLSEFLNTIYLQYLWPALKDCTKNAPRLESEDELFTAPLTARLMEINDCRIKLENVPKYINPGYYRGFVRVFNDSNDIKIISTVKIDSVN